jgi:preprotein translocase subunit SecG
MQTLVIVFHVVACLALIFIVLLQRGRGAEMGASFGGSSQTLFGSTGGTTFLGKLTTLAAVGFMLTCLSLAYLSGRPDTASVMEQVPVKEQLPVPEAKPIQPAIPAIPVAPLEGSTAEKAPQAADEAASAENRVPEPASSGEPAKKTAGGGQSQ